MTLEIGLLGSVEAHSDGGHVELRGDQQRRLLAYLALTPGRVRRLDGIIAALWPDEEIDVDHRQAVYSYASRLRGALPADAVVARDGGYALDVARSQVDAGRFEALVTEAADPGCSRERTLGLLAEGLALWRGRALDGFATEEWARGEAVRLDELRATAIDDRGETLIAVGRSADAVADLEAAAIGSPLRERTHRLLMAALGATGRQAEALRVFQRYRHRLATDLGLEPGVEIRQLESEIASAGDTVLAGGTTRSLRGYELGERIGDGAFSVVYRASQPAVGRDVAIKVVRAELANRPDFIRRFETEAHLVARLEHPYIVPLYDYWREPGSAYLVMRLLRGGSLEQRVVDHPLSNAEATTMATQVGAALAVAHRAGVVHRDVKPANIFLDGDGHFFLGDFGIAFEAAAAHQPADSLSIGSPAYASPEQLRREPVGPPADVHGLAITLFEALTGHLPFPDAKTQAELLDHQLHDPLPSIAAGGDDRMSEVDAVLAKATMKDPSRRYATVAEFVAEFTQAISGGAPAVLVGAAAASGRVGAATVVGELRNPFKGLRAFQEADAADFRGRQRLVDRLLEKLAGGLPSARFVTVVGPSGSGKSSVVRAGLLPAVRAGVINGSQDWFVTSMVPGAHPFEELESALNRIATAPTSGLAELMATDRRGIARAVKQACPVDGAEVLVVIDQFEELFTLCTDDRVRQAFIAGLVSAVSDPRSRLRVVATLRADFYDRPLRYPELAPLIESGAVTVSPLAADELDRVITEPAARVGAGFEPGLVARIVADVVDQPGALPLLQYALTELFDENISGLMTAAAYDELGGLSGALARRAEQVYADATPGEQRAIERVFARLVTLGEGTEDTRRRVKRSEFASDTDTPAVIDAYGTVRLLAFDRDPATREPTVEVAHEALIREWPRLRAWLDDNRDGLRLHRHLTTAATAWQTSGKDVGELYRGGRLETVEPWAAANAAELNPIEAEFVADSIDQRSTTLASQQRSKRRLQRAFVAVAAVAIVAMAAGGLAWQQQRSAVHAKQSAETSATAAEQERQKAEAAATIADANANASQAIALAPTALQTSLLLAVEGWKRAQTLDTRGGLLTSLNGAQHLVRYLEELPRDLFDTAITPDRQRLATITDTGTLQLWDTATWQSDGPPLLTSVDVAGPLSMSQDGRFLAVTAAQGARVFDLTTRQAVGGSIGAGEDPLVLSALNGDGSLIATVSGYAPRIDLWRTADASAVTSFTIADGDAVWAMVVAPDGNTLTVFAQGQLASTFYRFDLATARPIGEPFANPDYSAGAGDIDVSPDGTRLVTGSIGNTITQWDASSLARIGPPLNGHGSRSGDVRYSADGTQVIAAFDDGSVNIWDAESGAPIDILLGHNSQSTFQELRGGRIFTASASEAAEWDLAQPAAIGAALAPVSAVWIGDVRPVGSSGIVAVGGATRVEIVDGAGKVTAAIQPLGDDIDHAQVTSIDVSADGRYVAWVGLTNDDNGDITRMQIGRLSAADLSPAGAEIAPDELDFAGAIALSPDGSTVAVGTRFGKLGVFDASTGTVVHAFEMIDSRSIGALGFTRDGKSLIAGGQDGILRIFETVGWSKLGAVPLAPGAALRDVAFAQDGTQVFVTSESGEVFLVDLATRAVVGAPFVAGGTQLQGVGLSPDGTTLVASSRDGAIRFWDVASHRTFGPAMRGHDTSAQGATYVGTDQLFTGGYDGQLIKWDLRPDEWAVTACRLAGRNLTQAEWNQFLPSRPYASTCAEYPPGA